MIGDGPVEKPPTDTVVGVPQDEATLYGYADEMSDGHDRRERDDEGGNDALSVSRSSATTVSYPPMSHNDGCAVAALDDARRGFRLLSSCSASSSS